MLFEFNFNELEVKRELVEKGKYLMCFDSYEVRESKNGETYICYRLKHTNPNYIGKADIYLNIFPLDGEQEESSPKNSIRKSFILALAKIASIIVKAGTAFNFDPESVMGSEVYAAVGVTAETDDYPAKNKINFFYTD